MQKTDRALIATRFGELLRDARLRIGLSQEQLALDAGIDRTYVSMLERGTRVPTIVTLLQLAPHLHLPAFKLLKQLEETLGD